MERSRSLLVLAAAGASALAFAQPKGDGPPPPEFPPILQKVVKASKTLSFAGVREIFIRRPGGDPFRSRERVLRSGSKLRIEFRPESPFAGQVIVENGGVRYHYFPDTKEVHERPVFPDPLGFILGRDEMGMKGPGPGGGGGPHGPKGRGPGDGRMPGERWGGPGRRGGPGGSGEGGPEGPAFRKGGPWGPAKFITQKGREKVAGIPVTVVTMETPEGRVLQRLWVDDRKGLILRRRAYDPKGEALAGFEYLSIKYSPEIPAHSFDRPGKGATLITLSTALIKEAERLEIHPFRIPASTGWALIGVRRMDSEAMKFLWENYRSSKGRVSLFVVKGPVDGDKLSRVAGGGRIRTHIWTRDGLTLVLLGALSQADLQKLAESVSSARS